MRKFLFKTAIVLTICLSAVSFAWAAEPEDALSPTPEKAMSIALRVDDLGGFLRWALSEGNLKTFAPLMELDDDTIAMFTGILAGVQAKAAALSAGITADMTPFFQAAIVGSGAANVGEFIFGEGNPMAPMAESLLNEAGIAYEIKDGLLLLGFGPDGVKPSLDALSDESKRASFNRRFATRDFTIMHIDFDAANAIATANADDDKDRAEIEENFKNVKEYIRAPLDIEMGFESMADRFLVSVGMNLREALAEKYTAEFDDIKTVTGGHIKLLGEGSPMFALGTKISIKALKEHPEIKENWDEAIKSLREELGVTEQDVMDLLGGGLSLVLGGASVKFEEFGIPAAYISVEGQNGVAAKVINIVEQQAKSFINPIQVEGWDKMYQVDTSVCPVPCLTGTQDETIFAGMMDAGSLPKSPEPAARLSELLAKDSHASLWVDFDAVRTYLKEGLDGSLGMLLPLAADMAGAGPLASRVNIVKDVLNAKFSVPSMSIWGTDCETFFMDFATVEVPPEEGLWAKVVKAYLDFNAETEDDKGESDENKEAKD